MFKNPKIISVSPEIMSGNPVFHGTRVPVQTLLAYLKKGESINDFLDKFSTVKKTQSIEFIEEVGRQLVTMVA